MQPTSGMINCQDHVNRLLKFQFSKSCLHSRFFSSIFINMAELFFFFDRQNNLINLIRKRGCTSQYMVHIYDGTITNQGKKRGEKGTGPSHAQATQQRRSINSPPTTSMRYFSSLTVINLPPQIFCLFLSRLPNINKVKLFWNFFGPVIQEATMPSKQQVFDRTEKTQGTPKK